MLRNFYWTVDSAPLICFKYYYTVETHEGLFALTIRYNNMEQTFPLNLVSNETIDDNVCELDTHMKVRQCDGETLQ